MDELNSRTWVEHQGYPGYILAKYTSWNRTINYIVLVPKDVNLIASFDWKRKVDYLTGVFKLPFDSIIRGLFGIHDHKWMFPRCVERQFNYLILSREEIFPIPAPYEI